MRLSVSNIAWDVKDDEKLASFFKEQGLSAIDVAPAKYFSAEMTPTDVQIRAVKDFWASYGIEIVGMQSLLFGTTGLNVFETGTHNVLLSHLDKVARIGNGLGAKFLVFGSPKNRDVKDLSKVQIETIAKDFFHQLGDIGCKYNVIFCLEPNPTIYNCNFLTRSIQAATFVKNLNHPFIKVQLDTGTIVTNNEDFRNEILEYKEYIGHIHLSTTHLKPISSDKERLKPIFEFIKKELPNRTAAIEMVTSPEVFESVLFAKEII